MHVFVIGYPSSLGGADTELWHVLRLWRRLGWEVSLVPTWWAAPQWRARCNEIGAQTVEVAGPEQLADVPRLAQAVVVSFCNGAFLKSAAKLRELECRMVWVNCMTWMFPAERRHYERHGPFDAYVFQSQFQRAKLLPELQRYGVGDERCFHIPGTLAVDEFPFQPAPRGDGEEFVVGRLARPDLDKWSSNTWPIYGAIPFARRRARVMGWNDRLAGKLGRPPDWAETLPPCAETPQEFLARLHCLMPINGGAAENWPRVGLEAMAAGVPIVAQNAWGWQEMIDHGQTGFLADDDQQFAYYAARLAMDEPLRLQIARQARRRLEDELLDPDRLEAGWRRLFEWVRRKE